MRPNSTGRFFMGVLNERFEIIRLLFYCFIYVFLCIFIIIKFLWVRQVTEQLLTIKKWNKKIISPRKIFTFFFCLLHWKLPFVMWNAYVNTSKIYYLSLSLILRTNEMLHVFKNNVVNVRGFRRQIIYLRDVAITLFFIIILRPSWYIFYKIIIACSSLLVDVRLHFLKLIFIKV